MNDLVKKLTKNSRLFLILVGALAGLLLLTFGGERSDSGVSAKEESARLAEYAAETEEKIRELCLSVKGVSRVSVVVSFKRGFETVYARNDNKGSLAVVGSGSGKSAVRIAERMPEIGGIGIVCKGGGDPGIQKRLLDLISAAYGVSSSRIYIAEGKK